MSAIYGGHQIEALVKDGAQKLGEPFGLDVRGLRGHHHTGLGAEQFGGSQDSPKRASCNIFDDLHFFRLAAAETSKTGRVPSSADMAGRPHAEICFFQTSRSEYFPCSAVDPVRQPARCSKDC